MTRFRVASEFDECREAWLRLSPAETIGDLWEVRECFHRHYRRPLHFLLAEDESGSEGLLPLCWIEEAGCHGFFPGETWHGKTWLEQNRVFGPESLAADLLADCPSPRHLRYMLPLPVGAASAGTVDEVGYLFLPPACDYDIENYYLQFSRKSAKRLTKDLQAIEALGLTIRHNVLSDFEHIVALNLGRFGAESYFHDKRFADSFRDLLRLFAEKEMLRLTAIFIEGVPAAVDFGCVYRNAYTLLAGGVNPDFPGIAKFINTHHMKYSCEQKFDSVDFLCGDFSWKKLFHLQPRPLYLLSDWQGRRGSEGNEQAELRLAPARGICHHIAAVS